MASKKSAPQSSKLAPIPMPPRRAVRPMQSSSHVIIMSNKEQKRDDKGRFA